MPSRSVRSQCRQAWRIAWQALLSQNAEPSSLEHHLAQKPCRDIAFAFHSALDHFLHTGNALPLKQVSLSRSLAWTRPAIRRYASLPVTARPLLSSMLYHHHDRRANALHARVALDESEDVCLRVGAFETMAVTLPLHRVRPWIEYSLRTPPGCRLAISGFLALDHLYRSNDLSEHEWSHWLPRFAARPEVMAFATSDPDRPLTPLWSALLALAHPKRNG